jgi:hypothetical protein
MYRNPKIICNITIFGQILTIFFKESLILDPKNSKNLPHQKISPRKKCSERQVGISWVISRDFFPTKK